MLFFIHQQNYLSANMHLKKQGPNCTCPTTMAHIQLVNSIPTSFIFQRTDDSELQLLGTDYSSSLGDKVDTFLNRGNSIPAFLGSLTIDLFNAQTMVMDDQSTLNL